MMPFFFIVHSFSTCSMTSHFLTAATHSSTTCLLLLVLLIWTCLYIHCYVHVLFIVKFDLITKFNLIFFMFNDYVMFLSPCVCCVCVCTSSCVSVYICVCAWMCVDSRSWNRRNGCHPRSYQSNQTRKCRGYSQLSGRVTWAGNKWAESGV